jgi:hypothetical protein
LAGYRSHDPDIGGLNDGGEQQTQRIYKKAALLKGTRSDDQVGAQP